MITYSTLIGHVRPFFLSRGGDELANNERMMFYANCALQDIYNSDSATFTYKRETITGVVNGDKMKFITQGNIRKVQQCVGTMGVSGSIEMKPTLMIPGIYDKDWLQFETGSNVILTSTDITEIDVVYTQEYKWAELSEIESPIQVPPRYVPAVCKLMFDWASPVNLMS